MIVPLDKVYPETNNSKLSSGTKEEFIRAKEDVNETVRKITMQLARSNIKNINPEDLSHISALSFTIRRTLRPIDFLMKLCGLTYGSSCPLQTQFLVKHKIQRVYTILVAIGICISALRYIPSLIQRRKYPQLLKYEFFLWNAKCAIQALYCIFICSRYGRKISRFQHLISEYDEQLARYKESQDRKEKHKYQKIARFITVTLFGTVMLTMVLTGCNVFLPAMAEEQMHAVVFEPVENPSLPLKIFFYVLSFYLIVAWLLPVILYCYLCLSFCLVLDQFRASLFSLECNCINRTIEYIREEYHKLKELIVHTDDVIGFMALCVYCFDVILCCFHLFHFFYEAKNTAQRVAPAYQAVICLVNLVFMSFCASKVAEKVRIKLMFCLIRSYSVRN